MNENDSLRDVSDEEVTEILQFLKPLIPKSIHAYYFIDSLVKWKKKVPGMDIGILSPVEYGGHKSGAVIFYVVGFDLLVFSAFIWTKEGENALRNSLTRTRRFKSKDYKTVWITCIDDKVWSIIQPTLSNVLKDCSAPKIGHDQIYWLSAGEAAKLSVKIPSGVHLDDLKQEHASTINSYWPYKTEGTEELIKMMTWVNFGIGLFNTDNQLISWGFYWFFGALGILHTVETERRKGYGKLIVEAVCHKMGIRGLDVHLNIVEGNAVSEKFFKNLGFQHAFNCIWAVCEVITT